MWDTENRLIIENRTLGKKTDAEILGYVASVIAQGRQSENGRCYAYVSVWRDENIVVYASRNKSSDKFIVHFRMDAAQ